MPQLNGSFSCCVCDSPSIQLIPGSSVLCLAGLGRVVVGWLGRPVDGPRSRRSSRDDVESEEEDNVENGSRAEAHAASLAETRRPLALHSTAFAAGMPNARKKVHKKLVSRPSARQLHRRVQR